MASPTDERVGAMITAGQQARGGGASGQRPNDSTIQSMNASDGSRAQIADMRHRCAAHAQWISDHAEVVSFAERWADRNLSELREPASDRGATKPIEP